jgi:hypothetical protein
MIIKPLHSLQERGFLSIHFALITHIAPDGKAMLDAGIQVDLVGKPEVLEEILGVVALVAGEDGVGFGGGDR